MTLQGIPVSRGYVLGKVFVYTETTTEFNDFASQPVEDVAAEQLRLETAVKESTDQLRQLVNQLKESSRDEEAAIINNQLVLLRDPEIIDSSKEMIESDKVKAEYAIGQVVKETAELFKSMDDDEYLAARALDIEDIGKRILMNLSGINESPLSELSPNTIVIAEDLKPSDTASLDRTNTAAFVTQLGGPTSHTAILAKAMGIVAVLGAGEKIMKVQTGDTAIVDGCSGLVIVNPDEASIREYEKKKAAFDQEVEALQEVKDKPCCTRSGKEIVLGSNVGSLEEIDIALENGAEEVGLFRTEFLFLDRDTAPTEDEQYDIYASAVKKTNGNVIFRTIDIGGDKDVPYMNLPTEENPFLGKRALRLCFDDTVLFKTQLRALIRASQHGLVKIMFPMVGSVDDIVRAKALVQECFNELDSENVEHGTDVKTGIMIEIPAAAVIAEDLAKECDFFSIGTNDLVQYTLAVDRGNQDIASYYNPFHPAVLILIKKTIEAANQAGIPCGMCGEMAGIPEAIPTLLGYGLGKFSVSPSLLLSTKKIIRDND